MKVLCKKTYVFITKNLKTELDHIKSISIGTWYEAISTKDERFFLIKHDEKFKEKYIHIDYFYSQKELRQMKLKKLQNENRR